MTLKTTVCPKCGNFVSRNSRQCPVCGINVIKRKDLTNLVVIVLLILGGVAIFGGPPKKVATLQLAPELSYHGEVRDGKANGKGRVTYGDLGTVEGRFSDNSLVGGGLLVAPDGSTRKVMIKNGAIIFP